MQGCVPQLSLPVNLTLDWLTFPPCFAVPVARRFKTTDKQHLRKPTQGPCSSRRLAVPFVSDSSSDYLSFLCPFLVSPFNAAPAIFKRIRPPAEARPGYQLRRWVRLVLGTGSDTVFNSIIDDFLQAPPCARDFLSLFLDRPTM